MAAAFALVAGASAAAPLSRADAVPLHGLSGSPIGSAVRDGFHGNWRMLEATAVP
jgi:hypothetical protein